MISTWSVASRNVAVAINRPLVHQLQTARRRPVLLVDLPVHATLGENPPVPAVHDEFRPPQISGDGCKVWEAARHEMRVDVDPHRY